MAVLVPLARLRFLFVLGAIGLVIVKWDDLVARYEKYARPAASADAADPDHEYFCPMHPTVVRATNKEKCPICFMPLSKRKKGEAGGGEALPAGTVARVQLTPYRITLAGVKTAPVEYHALWRELTTVGTVEFDERKLKAVAARVKGRIDRLNVNQTGQMVHAGDALAELYSPDLVVTVQNLLDAREAKNAVQEKLARDRLKLWGIDDAQVEEIAKAGKAITHLTIRSPIDGHVLKKYVREGQYVEEGGPLFDVADLSTVWLQAQLYEDDLTFLPAGGHDPMSGKPDFELPVTATTRAFPGRPFRGTLSFLFPHVDAETRTLTVRFDLPNKDHELRPGMTATVTLKLGHDLLMKTPAGAGLRMRDGRTLAVPEGSVIDTGARKVVYRQTLPDTFDGVAVELGPKLSGPGGASFYPVLSGLAEGDRVVTAGSFLIDAETRLNPALGSTYIGGSSGGSAGAAVVRPTTPIDQDAKIEANMRQLPPHERKLAEAQAWCPVLGDRLGLMGPPIKVDLGGGRSVFVCCKSCTTGAKADPEKSLRRVEELKGSRPKEAAPAPALPSPPVPKLSQAEAAEARANLDKLPLADRKAAEAQRLCPVQGEVLGTMGVPIKVDLGGGRTAFVCCKSCVGKAQKNRDGVLKKVEELKKLPPVLPEGRP
jgi:RND family efflux transporter MFP subunit